MRQPQAVTDRARLGAALEHRLDVRPPRLDRRGLLLGDRSLDRAASRGLDDFDGRQVGGVAGQQSGLLQGLAVVPLGGAPHAEQAAHLAGTGLQAVKANELLQAVHLHTPGGHRSSVGR